jgi:acyl-CoA thioester hydrolase
VHLRASFLRFQYEVARKSDGRLLAEGESVHVVVGRDMKRTHLTEKYRDVLLAVVGAAETATES